MGWIIDEQFRKWRNKEVAKLGKGTIIFEFTVIDLARRATFKMGKNCTLHEFSYICANNHIEFGNNVRIASGCKFIDHNKKYEKKGLIKDSGNTRGRIKIGNNCWFGFNCTVLEGTQIGDNCVIGAGSVVNKKFPKNCVIAGVPAKIIKRIKK